MRIVLAVVSLLGLAAPALAQEPPTAGVFIGATPCGATITRFLGIEERCDFVRWELSLALDAKNSAPGPAFVIVEYGSEAQGATKTLRREISWANVHGTAERDSAPAVELTRGKSKLRLWRVNDQTLHFLDAKRALLVGTSRRSYTLSFAVAEAPKRSGDSAPTRMLPVAAGPDVYGVFEGRTPCDIAKPLNLPLREGCGFFDWRLTLFQDPKTRAPKMYRLEGATFAEAREGAITMLDGTPFDPGAKVLKLELPEAEQRVYERGRSVEPVHVMRGDENVLFFLDSGGKLGLGNRDWNYTLNRRRP